MDELNVEFEMFRKRMYNLEIRSFYLLLLSRGTDLSTLNSLFDDVEEKLSIKNDEFHLRTQSEFVQSVLERVISQEQTRARMDCFEKLYQKGMDLYEVLDLMGISRVDINLISDAAYVWQEKTFVK